MVLRPRNGISLCAGAGGLDLGLMLAEPGFHTRCFVEWEEHPRGALIAAQRAGYFSPAPIWDDVTTFDGQPYRGAIDTILAGYPCQPFSAAGQRKGDADERHLWPDVARILWETGAEWGFFENVGGHISLGLEAVLRDLWDMGWTPAVGLFSSREILGTHERQRVFIVARRARQREREPDNAAGAHDGELANADGGHPGSERQQRGGQLGFQPERGGVGGEVVGNAGGERRQQVARSPHGNEGADEGRAAKHTDQPECPEQDVGHSARLGRGEGRSEPEFRDGRGAAAEPGGPMADARGPGPQGRERTGTYGERDRQVAPGPAAQRGRPFISPPGPGDTAAWGAVLRMASDLAPSLAIRDLVSRAQDLAAMVAEGRVAETQAQSEICLLADEVARRPRSLKLLGNGVDPLVAGYAWRTLAAAHGLGRVDLEAAG